jgi:hypothetical protein
MGNTLLTFVDKYYEYGGDLDLEDRGLTIGGYLNAETQRRINTCLEMIKFGMGNTHSTHICRQVL